MTADTPSSFATSAAFRTALEQRLRTRALQGGVPLDRLRKEVAHQRLLARLVAVSPPGSWALKGGQALLARLGPTARATKDTDTTWRNSRDSFAVTIEQAGAIDLRDGFKFEIAAPRALQAETDDGGARFPILALLDHREFERIQLDVNFVPDDHRPLENVQLRDLLAFAHIVPPTVPAIPIAQHLAEKLHAYTRTYRSGHSSRPRDLYDMLVIAQSLPLPAAADLQATCRDTFALRAAIWPPEPSAPPTSWATPWSSYVADHHIPWTSLTSAYIATIEFWTPLLTPHPPPSLTWDADTWQWQ